MKIAFICDWLTGMRGGERCLEAMCEVCPQADIYTLVYYPENFNGQFNAHKITTSFIQNLPGNDKSFRRYLPLFPKAIESFSLSGYDCVISFSHCAAKSAIVPNNIPHVCYCHTPVRYVWHMRNEYLSKMPQPKKILANFILNYLGNWDKKTAHRVTHFIANSKNVQNRIRQVYNRDSQVIYPPVDCNRFEISNQNDGYYLVVSALVPYKRTDLAIKAFANMDQKLLVVGKGPELNSLKAIATSNTEFIDNASDKEVVQYMSRCKALLFPGEEDFGIVPLEAQACGKPVIAYGKGGALETVRPWNESSSKKNNATGVFFYEQNPLAIKGAILQFERINEKIDPVNCRNNALKFDRNIYKKTMQNYIQSIIAEF